MNSSNGKILLKILLLWAIIFLFDNFISSPLLNYMLPSFKTHLILEIIFKVLELLVAFSLNQCLFKQKVLWKGTISYKVMLFSSLLILLILFASFAHPSRIIESLTIGVIAAISEEYLCRGVLLGSTAQLKYFTSKKGRILFAIIFSSLLFSFYHLGNLRSQEFTSTLQQMIETFGMGILLGVLYVRTASLFIPMIVHFSADYFVVAFSNNIYAGPQKASFTGSIIHLIIYLILAWVFMDWSSKKTFKLLTK